MVLKKLASAFLIMSLSTAGFAESFADRPDLGQHNRAQRNDRPDNRDNRAQRNDRRDRRDDRGRRYAQPGRPDHPGYQESWRGRSAGSYPSFHRGGRLPSEYRSRQYVVDDWRAHHLSPPPRGYHWVQTGADYVLVAIATGIIMQIIMGN